MPSVDRGVIFPILHVRFPAHFTSECEFLALSSFIDWNKFPRVNYLVSFSIDIVTDTTLMGVVAAYK